MSEGAACCTFAFCPIAIHNRIDDEASCSTGQQVHAERFNMRIGKAGANGDLSGDAMLTGNARTALAISAAVLPAMQAARQGRIVHVAALAGQKASAGMAAYAASKAALLRLTEAIAEEYRKDGITANCVLPGVIDTPPNRAAMPKADTSTWVAPEAIARLIAFLLSAEGGVVTGGAIPATGVPAVSA